jgi:hypothetical protein
VGAEVVEPEDFFESEVPDVVLPEEEVVVVVSEAFFVPESASLPDPLPEVGFSDFWGRLSLR